MKAYDFEYDGVKLSDIGFIICKFDSSNVDTIDNGSQITFNTVPTLNGMKHELTSSTYEDCLNTTFQICKNKCESNQTDTVSFDEMRTIMSWLNRKGFHKFRLLDDEYSGVYFEASFNVSRIEVSGMIYGFELEMFTNRPFAIREPIVTTIKNVSDNGINVIYNESDEEGCIYPDMEITIGKDGDFTMKNSFNDRVMRIANCKKGEVIKVSYPMISSSLTSHKVQNDFNWAFFRLENTFRDKKNKITLSLPCTVKISYSPIVKVTI